jgi:membrane dipeptidase
MRLIVDSHLDLAWNALQWNRDLTQSVYTLRVQEASLPRPARGQNTVALPELSRGWVALCFSTLLARSTGRPEEDVDYASPVQAYAVAQGQLAYYRALDRQGHIRLIASRAELDAHMAAWEAWADRPAGTPPPLGCVISMESADPILSPEHLPDWQQAGVRIIGPAHFGPGRYAGGTGTELSLTPSGIALLQAMRAQNVLLDVSHLSDQAFWQALDHYDGPLLASHNNCRALVPHQRQLDDAQLRALVARDAVVGLVCDNWMLRPGWVKDARENPPASLADVADQIDHVCQLAGDSRHAGLGSDLDGGFGREQSPADLDTIADLQRLGDLLEARGYGQRDIAAILHGNWLDLLRRAWPA